jgi:hypothetical protein
MADDDLFLSNEIVRYPVSGIGSSVTAYFLLKRRKILSELLLCNVISKVVLNLKGNKYFNIILTNDESTTNNTFYISIIAILLFAGLNHEDEDRCGWFVKYE